MKDSAILFLYIGAYFLCSHELGHLALGHLDRNNGTNAAIVEIDTVTDEEKLESRAREWDADIFASAATLWYLGQLAGEEGWSEVLADYDKTFRFFMATTYHIFTVFDFLFPHNRGKFYQTHPEPMVRAGIIIPAIDTLISNWKEGQDVMAIGKATITVHAWLKRFEVGINSADVNRLLDRLEYLQELDIDASVLDDILAHRIIWLRQQGESLLRYHHPFQ